MRIGLAVVATGKYLPLAVEMARSAREYFLRQHHVRVFIGSETHALLPHYAFSCYWQHWGWPGATLYRHSFVLGLAGLFEEQNYDYVFMVDADMRFVAPVGDEILSDLVGTIHPGFWNKPRSQFTYEDRPESRAYIPHGSGEKYYAGGFQGGRTATYLAACREIARRIDADEDRGITAVWHDESHWNRYLFENPPTLELDPGYCYPESWDLPFGRKLLALDKDHSAMRA